MKKAIAGLMLVCLVTTGCTGSFSLTKKVYNWHHSNPDKWLDEGGFLVCILLPIYGISTFADAIVFNSIEFWTGENPVTASADTKTKQVKEGTAEATISYNAQSDQLTVASNQAPTLTFEKGDNMVLAKNTQGDVLYASSVNENGDLTVYDRNLEPVKSYSADEVAAMKEKYTK